MDPKQRREAALKAAREIAEAATKEGRDLTDDEQTEIEAKLAEADQAKADEDKSRKSSKLLERIGSLGGGQPEEEPENDAKSLGDHFVKTVGDSGLARLKEISGTTLAAPEFKVATDTHTTPTSLEAYLTQLDRTIVRGFRRPVVSDILGDGTLGANSNAVTYLVEAAVEGGFATVGEAGAKPQFHMVDPTTRTDALRKIAGFLKFSDEMAEDAPFWVSEINQRGLYLLSLAEENQLLNGDGVGNNVLGMLNRSGIQTEAAADRTDNADALFRSMTAVSTATGLSADGILINPADYETLRLARDANGQYYGGGYFQGQYGNGGVPEQPPVWGLRTIVTPAVAAGTAVVGAFQAATSVYRKGGVRVESTNTHASDFTSNLITTRIEERVALAVRYPAAIVQVTLSNAAPV